MGGFLQKIVQGQWQVSATIKEYAGKAQWWWRALDDAACLPNCAGGDFGCLSCPMQTSPITDKTDVANTESNKT